MEGEYKINSNLSEPVKDLVKKILTVDPQNRYTIEQIRRHPWMIANCPHRKSTKGIVIGYNKIPIDMQILKSIS